MSTETRIGIVAGLLIVVVASVYFFYGARRPDEDVLVAVTAKPLEAVKIPIAGDHKSAAPAKPTPSPLTQSQPRPASPSALPAKPLPSSASPPSGVQHPALTGPPADQIASATGIDKYRLTVPPALPESSPVSPAPTPLRTSPSPQLIEATRENLKPVQPSPETSSPRIKIPPDAEPKPATAANGQKLAAMPDAEFPKRYTVVRGDTVASLAKQYYQDARLASEIQAANPSLKNRRKLKPGEIIIIPAASRAQEPEPAAAVASEKTYTVQSGDTIYAIARKFCGDSNRWREVFELNKDQLKGDPKRLRPGMVLKLPA